MAPAADCSTESTPITFRRRRTCRPGVPLARRPYDLRHAAVSTWLNAGVPAPQVAEWAGHGVDVLLRIYAKCIEGQQAAARKRISAALLDGLED